MPIDANGCQAYGKSARAQRRHFLTQGADFGEDFRPVAKSLRDLRLFGGALGLVFLCVL